jgi:hypothetical protein
MSETEKEADSARGSEGTVGAHTPGPWQVIQHHHAEGELWLSVNGETKRDGSAEWIAEIRFRTADEARQRADARLIAAAPDQSLALRGAPKPLSRHANADERLQWAEAYERWYVGSRAAAISKATGR